MTSLFDSDDVGPAINASHTVLTVDGQRAELPEGWTKRTRREVDTDYGKRIDIVYEYPDGTEIVR